jgi:hypothetical protein
VSALLEASPQPGDVAGQQALAWGRSSRLALREFNAGDHAALVEMHQDTRLREHLVDDYPLHESAVASLFLERLMQMYRRQEGLGIWHATALQSIPAFVGWFSLMPLAGRPGELELGKFAASRLQPARLRRVRDAARPRVRPRRLAVRVGACHPTTAARWCCRCSVSSRWA